MDFSPASWMCSFCGKQGEPDTEFAGGFGVMVCVECLDYLHATVHSPAHKQAMRKPPWESMTDTELLATLPLILRSSEQVNEFASQWVGLARDRGISWAAIGNVLGVSRQAVWERFARTEAPRRQA